MTEKLYTQNDMNEMRDKSMKAGQTIGEGHSNPSPETLKMVGNLDKKLEVYCTKMEDLKETVVEGFKKNGEEHSAMMEAVKAMMDEKANKWTEQVLIGAGSAIGLGFLSLIGWLIVEAIKRFQ